MKHIREDYQRIQDPAGLIPEDEPVLLLRAQDVLGCEAARYYAELCKLHQKPKDAEHAQKHADAMMAWSTKKIPDVDSSEKQILTPSLAKQIWPLGDREGPQTPDFLQMLDPSVFISSNVESAEPPPFAPDIRPIARGDSSLVNLNNVAPLPPMNQDLLDRFFTLMGVKPKSQVPVDEEILPEPGTYHFKPNEG